MKVREFCRLRRGMVCISVNVVSAIKCRRTAKGRICSGSGSDDRCIKLVAKSKDFRLYSTDLGINGNKILNKWGLIIWN
jgi:hypothetical protein